MKLLVISNLYPPNVLGGYEILCEQVCKGKSAVCEDAREIDDANTVAVNRVVYGVVIGRIGRPCRGEGSVSLSYIETE